MFIPGFPLDSYFDLSFSYVTSENYSQLRKHLVKHYGGASEDVRQRESHFDAGMPDKPGGKPFPKGILEKH